MGYYTGLRFKGVLKPEFVPVMRAILACEKDKQWKMIAEEYPQYPFLKRFSLDSSSSKIPSGVLKSVPAMWHTTDDFDLKLQGHVLTFQCSLENKKKTIELFFATIVKNMFERTFYIEKVSEDLRYGYEHGVLYDLEETVYGKTVLEIARPKVEEDVELGV